MALLFVDSCAHYTNAQGARKWELYVAHAIVPGRFPGSSALQLIAGERVYKTIPARQTVIAGCSLYLTSQSLYNVILLLEDGGTVQIHLQIDIDGLLKVRRGGQFGTLIAQSGIALKSNVWYHVALKATIHPTAGAIKVQLNGATVIDVAGVNTQTSGVSQVTRVGFGGVDASKPETRQGDFYIADTNGVLNNDLLGDVRVQALAPTGAGTYAQWDTLVGAATQWQAVADATPDDDTSYVASTTPGELLTAQAADLVSVAGTVKAVAVTHCSRKDDAGTRTVAGVVRSGGLDAAAAGSNVGNSYAFYQDIFETDPAGAAWTVASVNAAEIGVKEVA